MPRANKKATDPNAAPAAGRVNPARSEPEAPRADEPAKEPTRTRARSRTAAERTTPPPGPRVAPELREPIEALAAELRAVREQFAELGREAEAQAQAAREERAAVRREVAELRDQVRTSYHKSLREALDGLETLRAGAAEVPPGLREGLDTAAEDSHGVATTLRDTRGQAASLGEDVRKAREQVTMLARELTGAEGPARAARERAAREIEALREQALTAHLDFLRAALEGLDCVRSVASDVTTQLNGARRLAHEVGERLRYDIEVPIGTVREELREASTVLHELPKQAEESRQRVEEVLQRLSEAEETREPAEESAAGPPAERGDGHTRLGVTVEPGVVVAEVEPGSPAAVAGVSPGDVIAAVNEKAVHDGPQLRDAVGRVRDGDELMLRLARGHVAQDVKARLAPSRPGESEPAEGHNRLGVTVEPGVVVKAVLPGSPAEAAGLNPGDVIGGVDGTPVSDGEHLRSVIRSLPERAEVTLQVVRGREASELKARLDETE